MPSMTQKDAQEFDGWWSKHGQFCRAGGGDYEKTFAYHAWERQADRYNFVADRRSAIEQRLFVWAHEKLDEERKTEYFNIIANGMESVHDDNNTMRLLNQEKYRALIAERERDALEAELNDTIERWSRTSKNEADAMAECQQQLSFLRGDRDALQAKLDKVMLEYCPDEMTPEQKATWARHQQPVAALESEILEQCRLNGMGAEREVALLGKVERLTRENAVFQNAVVAGIGHLAKSQQQYQQVMGLLRDMQMEHGTCQPRERRACTHCNAKDDLDKLLAEYRGQSITQA